MNGKPHSFLAGVAFTLAAGAAWAQSPNAASPYSQPAMNMAPAAPKAPTSYVGAVTVPVEFDPSEATGGQSGGMRIEFVLDNSPASIAGLRPGDIVLTVNGRVTATSQAYLVSTIDLGANTAVQMQVLRDGKAFNVSVTTAARPPDVDAQTVTAAKTQRDTERRAADDAFRSGDFKRTLDHDVRAFRLDAFANDPNPNEFDAAVLVQLAEVLPRLKPPPAIPGEADRYNRRGLAMIKAANTDEDFDNAAKEFGHGIYTAPWVAALYRNAALTDDKAGNTEAALTYYRLYRIISPVAAHDEAIKQKIAELEVQAEERKPWLPFIGSSTESNGTQDFATLRGREFALQVLTASSTGQFRAGDVLVHGQIHGRQFAGKDLVRSTNPTVEKCYGAVYELDSRGALAPDGGKISIEEKGESFDTASCRPGSPNWTLVRTLVAAPAPKR